jgi:hypothetical protein
LVFNNKRLLPMHYDTRQYKVWNWKHPLVLHWILNPGLAVNELLPGQRVPKVMLVERDKSKTLAERSFVPCPHCHTIHSALKWSPQNGTAFKNWFGLYCDHCGRIIPCQWNATSLIILAITFPIWYWFRDRWKERWLEVQREKFSRSLSLTPPELVWWKTGLGFGIVMFVCMELISPLLDGSGITARKLLIGVPVWVLAGLLFGRMVKIMFGTKPKKGDQPGTQQSA